MISDAGARKRIAIAGGGFSGTLVLAHLVREASTPIAIDLFEANGSVGTGVAYSTTDIVHLLNVRSDFMGAFPGELPGFYHWLQTGPGKEQAAKLWPGHEIRPDGYAPRLLYAHYLKHILEDTLKLAQQKNIPVTLHPAQLVDAEETDGTLSLSTETQHFPADALVLATGNLPPRRFGFEKNLAFNRYVPDIWNPSADSVLHRIGELPDTSRIVIIGSGLTAIDASLTLQEQGYRGTITAISRHGHIPAGHTPTGKYPDWEWMQHPQRIPNTALGLFARLRQEIRAAAKQGHDWRGVIDSLRPLTQSIWQKLSLAEKRKFMQRLFTLWNIHRHRMAPEVAAEIASLRKNGRLKLIAGKIINVKSSGDALTVTYRARGSQHEETLAAALLINCTGPEYNLATCPSPLLNNLHKRGLITPHALGTGMQVNQTGSATGSGAIFPIGTLLIGELLECTAVPELRGQAQATAMRVLQRLQYLDKTTPIAKTH